MTNTIPPSFGSRASVESYRVAVVWPDELVGAGIIASEWSSAPAGLELSAPVVSGAETSVRVAGGVAGTRYAVRNVVEVAGADGPEIYAVSVPIDCTW